MPIVLPQPTLDRTKFVNLCDLAPTELQERIAEMFPQFFAPAFVFGDAPPDESNPTAPTKPGPAKARESSLAAKADRSVVLASVESIMATHPGRTASDYTEMLASVANGDPEFGTRVKRACEALVKAGKACFDGAHKSRTYKPMPKGNAQEPESAE